jgi:hypothetical protein
LSTYLTKKKRKMAHLFIQQLKSGPRWRVQFHTRRWKTKTYTFYDLKSAKNFIEKWEKVYVLEGPQAVKYDRYEEKWKNK